jgi:phosphoribosylformylglycinamidine synthase
MLWHLEIRPSNERDDRLGRRLASEAADLGLPGPWNIAASRGFLVEGELDEADLRRAGEAVLVDPVAERSRITPGHGSGQGDGTVVHVLPKPGVTDPEAESARAILRDLGYAVDHVRSIRTYRLDGPRESLPRLIRRVLANEAVEQAVIGPLPFDRLGHGHPYRFRLVTVPVREMGPDALMATSREGQLSLGLDEMLAIQAHFCDLGRDPTDCELETIAQTWSEHCSHKTLKGRIELHDGGQVRTYENLLKETIFGATRWLEREGGVDWLVSVFHDNAGVVRFDEGHDVCFKVETHNHPSAIDPYGGSNTGLGGVIRDVLGTGLGAKPICNTDVFCVADPDTPAEGLPPGVIHPRRLLQGVVAGVRDYGNRMGIPTVNGALVVDPGYVANPLVYCGTVGVLPRGMAEKRVSPGDRIVAIGGRTGRDGIHGATFSSVELSSESEDVSGGAVQIGDAIVEKQVLDVVIRARDLGIFHAITDCGAGGFSSAVGEMGAEIGAEVELGRAPLKYEGLSYTEIWISEAQERMVLAVPPDRLDDLFELCREEGVEATDLGQFVPTGRLTLRYHDQVVGDLSMEFLHEGRPKVTRRATRTPARVDAVVMPTATDHGKDLLALLRVWDVSSKEWIIRQYDHEVQARTVIKPLVGVADDGPGDAAVVLPVRGSTRGLAVSCGINPRPGLLDPYAMAACAIDEAVRNCVAVGADPGRIALLDNFCWGSPERPETLGSLVLAAEACRDLSIAFRTPFISGKDSLYNEYVHDDHKQAIPGTLLISAIGIVPDVRRCVTMDLKSVGNLIILVGVTGAKLGGSLWSRMHGLAGGRAPRVEPANAPRTFQGVHHAITQGWVRSCHDLSEGGLAVALAEMALSGGLGVRVELSNVPHDVEAGGHDVYLLFSESPSRFLLEVRPEDAAAALGLFGPGQAAVLGEVRGAAVPRLTIVSRSGSPAIDLLVAELKSAWRRTL